MLPRWNRTPSKITEVHFEFASRLRFLRIFGLKVYLNASRPSIISILDEFPKELCDNLAEI